MHTWLAAEWAECTGLRSGMGERTSGHLLALVVFAVNSLQLATHTMSTILRLQNHKALGQSGMCSKAY